jgi:hypothetical protein
MKTIVGSFDSFDEAKRVARDLMDEGFRDSDVNVVASNVRGEYSAAGSTAGLAGTSATTGMTGVTGATTTDYTRNRTAADSTLTTDGGGPTGSTVPGEGPSFGGPQFDGCGCHANANATVAFGAALLAVVRSRVRRHERRRPTPRAGPPPT